ncbi:MAG: DUF3667 domain-containing protein [Pseudomonadota bacterium]
MDNPKACSNCGGRLDPSDRFCGACGQKVLRREDRTFAALLGRVAEEVTSVNGRLLPTFASLILRPGALSKAHRLGQWQRYLAPISVFMLANLAFFLAPSVTDYSLTLVDQKTLQPYSASMRSWIDARQAASGLSSEAFTDAYNQRVGDVSKTMVILHVPLIALVTLLLFYDRRLLFADHVVTVMHFFAFLMLYFAVWPVLIRPLLSAMSQGLGGALPVFQVGLLLPLLYVPPMLRTAFGVGWPRAIVSLAGFLFVYFLAQFVYRFSQLILVATLVQIAD